MRIFVACEVLLWELVEDKVTAEEINCLETIYIGRNKKEEGKEKKLSARGLPKRSPTLVLTSP